MTLDRIGLSKGIDPDTVRSATKVLLGAAALVFVGLLVTVLPGMDRIIPGTPVTIAAVVSAIAAIVLAALLVSLAPKLATVTRMALSGPRQIVAHVSSTVHWVVVLAAVLVAHSGLAALVTPFLGDLAWLYDAVFLLLALPAVALIAARLYAAIDPTADLVAERVGTAEEGAETDEDGAETAEEGANTGSREGVDSDGRGHRG